MNAKRIAALLCSALLLLSLAACSGKAEPATLTGVYNAVPVTGQWYIFQDVNGNQYTNVRAAQLFLYSDGTYMFQDTFHEFDKIVGQAGEDFDMVMDPMCISITTTGTYTSEEDPETDGKIIVHLSDATRVIYSASDPFFADSQGHYDSSDESTKEAFSTNTKYGANPDQLLVDFGHARDLAVNTTSGVIETPLDTGLYNEGHITFHFSA